MKEKILEVKNLEVSFKTYAGISHAVRGIDFNLHKGETLAIVGESGCGKTVSSKAIMRLLPESNTIIGENSEVLFHGEDLLKKSENEMVSIRGSKISMIFQDPMTSLNPTMKIGDQIAESILIHRQISKEEAYKEALEMLQLVKIPNAEKRMKQYPFEFVLDITWKLEGEKITITYQVKNTDDKKMYFGIGGHPGFQIPIEKNLKFEDYRIDFGEDPKPRRILFSEDCFVLEEDEAFALEEGRYLNLEHNLFDDDAIVLKEMPREVTLESAKGSKKITVAFPDMDYLGIWHWPHVEVDYVCIEPWSSLPSRKNVVEDLEKQADLLSLESGQEYTNTWSITIKEK